MEVVTIDSEVWQGLLDKIDMLEDRFKEIVAMAKKPLGEKWLDNNQVCLEFNLTIRTLASYRKAGILPYTMIGGKCYYAVCDLKKVIDENYVDNGSIRR